MKSFEYTVTSPFGLHARPAGALVKTAKSYPGTEITLERNGKTVNCTYLLKLMALGIKHGDTVKINVSGKNEDSVSVDIEKFFRENF
ncbi:MAG: HPr family phosphocarrier protein [Spirochaetia bacterium]|nr:HPr family phosphocarrier protein [Spirochaetia bacterium]